jgi:hypothetical protein
MKPKEITKNRKAEREYDVALAEMSEDFGMVIDPDLFLDRIEDYEIDFEEDD